MHLTTQFLHGRPLMVDHTPVSAVTAGDVVVVGDEPRIAHLDIAANRQGSLAAGGGVYDAPKAITSGSAIAAGKKVFWDAGAKVVTETAGGNKVFGRTVSASADADTTQRVIHDPSA